MFHDHKFKEPYKCFKKWPKGIWILLKQTGGYQRWRAGQDASEIICIRSCFLIGAHSCVIWSCTLFQRCQLILTTSWRGGLRSPWPVCELSSKVDKKDAAWGQWFPQLRIYKDATSAWASQTPYVGCSLRMVITFSSNAPLQEKFGVISWTFSIHHLIPLQIFQRPRGSLARWQAWDATANAFLWSIWIERDTQKYQTARAIQHWTTFYTCGSLIISECPPRV